MDKVKQFKKKRMQDMKTINLTSAETLSINRGSETAEAVAKTKCHHRNAVFASAQTYSFTFIYSGFF